MKFIKPRKKRGLKRNGDKSFDLCPCCYAPYCDPMLRHPKVERRLRAGLCPACGMPKGQCRCRSSLKASGYIMVVHNNRKERRNDGGVC